jgi:predicted permease
MLARDADVVLLGEDVWASSFGRDPDIVGQLIDVNGREHRIIGVLPGDWRFPADEQMWVPLVKAAGALQTESHPGMRLVGRLAEDASLARATAETDALVANATPLEDRQPAALVRPFARGFSDPAQVPIFWAAVTAMVLLVLVAAANVSNLVLARTEARRSELAVRSALGASRGRIVGQVFTEALALTGVAAGIAVLLSNTGLAWLERMVPGLPYYVDLSPTVVVVGFAALLAGLAAALAGAFPALRSTRGGMAEGVRMAKSVGFGRFSQVVIVAEIALSVALLGTAFAFGQSFLGYTRGSVTELDDERILTATLYTPWQGEIVEEEEMEAFATRVREDIRETFRTEEQLDVGFTLDLPGTEAQTSRIEVEGDPTLHAVRGVSVDHGFFDVIDVEAQPGRTFEATDFEEGAGRAYLVNEPFVQRILQGRNPIGRAIRFHYGDGTQSEWGEVVGVVPVLNMNPGDPSEAAAVYRTLPGTNYKSVLIRVTDRDPFALVPALREAAFRVDPRVQVREPRLLRDAARDQRAILSGFGAALFIMGAMALLLSAAGLYAVISFGVSRRTREIGVRIALGARAGQVIETIGRRVARNLLIGLAAGLALGWGLLQAVGMFEFTIRVNPIVHLGGPAVLLLLAGAVSVWRPITRALSIQPAEALRAD